MIGLILTNPEGKNNGTVKSKVYFTCEENFGLFSRRSNLKKAPNPVLSAASSTSDIKSSIPRVQQKVTRYIVD